MRRSGRQKSLAGDLIEMSIQILLNLVKFH